MSCLRQTLMESFLHGDGPDSTARAPDPRQTRINASGGLSASPREGRELRGGRGIRRGKQLLLERWLKPGTSLKRTRPAPDAEEERPGRFDGGLETGMDSQERAVCDTSLPVDPDSRSVGGGEVQE